MRWLLLALLLAAAPARAVPFACPEHFAHGQPPELLNSRLAQGARPLCFAEFATLHSAASRTPLFSAERLTRARLARAADLPRQGRFHPEPRLPAEESASLADYVRSGFDRGHMAPSGDMSTPQAQEESFSLANIVPQAHGLNTGLWERIERGVRAYARRHGRLYVVTGPAFVGDEIGVAGRVLVPTHVWKAIYDPARGQAGAYLAANRDEGGWRPVSLQRLEALTGIAVFPGLAPELRARTMSLPPPAPGWSRRWRR